MKLRGLLLLMMVLALAGCTALRTTEPAEPAAPVEEVRGDAAEAGRVLAYYARVRQLPAAELAREHEAARRALARTRSDGNRVRYALLLTLPGTAAGEDARALELLEPVARNTDSALRGLALLVSAMLQEQRRLETHAQGVQHKLDALLTLERSMTGRDSGGARKKPAP